MKRVITLLGAIILMSAGFAVAAYATGNPPGQNPCSHGATGKNCKPDPGPGKDCEHHGNYGGQNEDHCKPENPPPTTTTPTTPTGTTPTTPSTPRCPPGMTPTAGKDGKPGNDECEYPKTTTTVTPPPVTQTVTVTVPTPPTVITKTVVKYKTRVVYRTKYKDRIVRKTIVLRRTCGCPVGTRLYNGKCHPKVPAKG